MLTWKGRYSGARLNGQTRRPSSSSSPFLFKTRLSYRFLLADSSDSAKKCLEMCAISRSNAVARSTSTQPFMLVLGMRLLSATLSITLKEHKTFSVHPNFAQVRNDSALRFYFSFLFSVPADASHLFFFSAVLWLGLMARTQRLKGHNGKMEQVEGKEGRMEGRKEAEQANMPQKTVCSAIHPRRRMHFRELTF